MSALLVLNGPNLNLLGTRQPEIYGSETLKNVEANCLAAATNLGHSVEFLQSNHEGVLIDALHGARDKFDGIVLNAGAYSHTSIAIRDAIASIEVPTVEVHVSNIHARETFRHHSFITSVALGIISGFGIHGYVLALQALDQHLTDRK
ncbi:MAG: type II 3-dehydroquinate dehydratase [Boseongicola sp.]|nr:MAG: type II 3-dehydroquinate dehydratase [Boseongicola sp.]